MFLRRCKTDLISQRGAALVVALLVFALAAALMVGLQRDFTLQLQRTSNVLWGEQMWAYLRGAESLAIQALRYDQHLDAQSESPRDTLLELWAGPPTPYALDEGSMQGALTDLQGRFNVNALVKQERLAPQEPDEPADAIPADAADGIEQSAGTSAASLTWDGIAIHGGSEIVNGYASHGCIAVPDPLAAKLFEAAKRGDKVVITRGKMIGVGDPIA